jgi:hypothetical protein
MPVKRLGKLWIQLRRSARWLACLVIASSFVLVPADVAWAKTKKKKEEEVETKSYVVPYMIVISLVSVGIMTVCRPGSRLDKADDKKREKEEE